MAAIFVLSAQPGLRISEDPAVDLPLRRVAHVAAYGLLALLLLRPLSAFPIRRAALTAFVVTLLWAVSDEMHQSLVPDRRGVAGDVVIDAAGALLGLAGAVAWRSRWRVS
jgi:VanZ family protein